MFTFTPLPLATEVGLRAAAGALDVFLPRGGWEHEAGARAVGLLSRAAWLSEGGRGRSRAGTPQPAMGLDLVNALRAAGDPGGAELVLAGWEFWQENRHGVERALNAETARAQWAARRRVENTPGNRRQAKAASQAAELLVPPAVGFADKAASTINGASQGVMTPLITLPERKRFPSWA